MFPRSLTILLLCLHGLTTIAQPVLHDVCCPTDGWLVEFLRAGDTGQDCCCEFHGICGAAPTTNRQIASTPTFTPRRQDESAALTTKGRVKRCDGECAASVLENSPVWRGNSNDDSYLFVRSSAIIRETFDRSVSTNRVRSRGPPLV